MVVHEYLKIPPFVRLFSEAFRYKLKNKSVAEHVQTE
jgi:hypothetical protein